ncbi:hypothetical protein Dimus_024581 [Dionaea muscipula]
MSETSLQNGNCGSKWSKASMAPRPKRPGRRYSEVDTTDSEATLGQQSELTPLQVVRMRVKGPLTLVVASPAG